MVIVFVSTKMLQNLKMKYKKKKKNSVNLFPIDGPGNRFAFEFL